jgi:hypothetical protein
VKSRIIVVPYPVNNSYDPQGEFTVAIYRLSDSARLTDEDESLWNFLDGMYWWSIEGNGALSSGFSLADAIDLSIEMSMVLNNPTRWSRSAVTQ